MRNVNLGCGYAKLRNYINVDFNPECNPDIVHNLEKGLPFDSNSADEIIANDFMEHCKDFVSIMNEIGRVLKVGGVLKARFPPWNSEGAFSAAHPRIVIYRDFEAFCINSANSFEYSVNGEKLNKRFKMIQMKTEKGVCHQWCKEGKHRIKKCHVIIKKIL